MYGERGREGGRERERERGRERGRDRMLFCEVDKWETYVKPPKFASIVSLAE